MNLPARPWPTPEENTIRLTAYTNYAMRILMFCAVHRGEHVRIQDVAEAFDISRAHLLKAARQLGQLGYLETTRGRSGGVRLGLPAEEIDVGEVIRVLEDSGEFVECFNRETNTCPIAGTCRLTALFRRALEAFYRELDGVTLAELVGDGRKLRDMLPVLETS